MFTYPIAIFRKFKMGAYQRLKLSVIVVDADPRISIFVKEYLGENEKFTKPF